MVAPAPRRGSGTADEICCCSLKIVVWDTVDEGISSEPLVDRLDPRRRTHDAPAAHPSAALAGPLRCGETMPARKIAAQAPRSTRFDLGAAIYRKRLKASE